MMSTTVLLLQEIKQEIGKTIRLLDSLPEDNLEYKPHEQSMSLGELANHVVDLFHWVEKVILSDGFDWQGGFPEPRAPEGLNELKARLQQALELNLDMMSRDWDEDFWQSTWTLRDGDLVYFELPRYAAFRDLSLNHLYHHRGQLTVYLRLLDRHVPGMFGPSFDDKQENWA
jgi:uncharacterized damage-inducible protein DinB